MKFLPLPWLLYLTIHCKATDRSLTFGPNNIYSKFSVKFPELRIIPPLQGGYIKKTLGIESWDVLDDQKNYSSFDK